MNNFGPFKFIAWVFMIGGLGCLAGGIYTYQNTYRFISNARPVQAHVTNSVLNTSGGTGISDVIYIVSVNFQTEQGKLVHAKFMDFYNYQPGETVSILYDPKKPEVIRLEGQRDIWSASYILFGLGIIFLLVGLFFKKRASSPVTK